jgi:CubicO group peptidase (beta-lactamase class C family)
MTPTLDVTLDGAAAGFDPNRLAALMPRLQERYIDSGLFAGLHMVVARGGQAVLSGRLGVSDLKSGDPLAADAIYRIYSMTKPITSVAAMMLYEEGRFLLDDPVSRFLPALAELRVYDGGTVHEMFTRPAEREVTIRDLFLHTAGFTYDWVGTHPVDQLYAKRGVMMRDRRNPGDSSPTTEAMVDRLAAIPLLYSPGSRWEYSVATDVLGRLVEVISGETLDQFFARHIFGPLGMVDTGFVLRDDNAHRMVAGYYGVGDHPLVELDPAGTASSYCVPTTFHSGGGGLYSTVADYFRFTQMLIRGGELDGVRLLGRKTVEYMVQNHLPTGGDLATMGKGRWDGVSYEGLGWGLGFAVVVDPVRTASMRSTGEYFWGGMASTMFWNDPAEDITAMLFAQRIPSINDPVRRHLLPLVYSALL